MSIYLKQWRKKRGLTQVQLAELSNVGRAYISHLEAGINEAPSKVVINALASALDITPGQLFEDPDTILEVKAGGNIIVDEVKIKKDKISRLIEKLNDSHSLGCVMDFIEFELKKQEERVKKISKSS